MTPAWPRHERMTTAAVAEAAAAMRASGRVLWPWPASIAVDDPQINIETFLVAAMNYIKSLAASSMPRDEQERVSLDIAHGLIENGLLLSQARREASGKV